MNCFAGIVPIQNEDKFSFMQCPKNYMERKTNEINFIQFYCGKSYVCANMYKTRYQFCGWNVRKVPNHFWNDHWKVAKKKFYSTFKE